MKIMKGISISLLSIVLCSVIINDSFSSQINSALDQANKSFTYKGKPINPLLIKEFEIWLSDNCPSVVTSVDLVAGAKARNEYDTDNIEIDKKIIRARKGNEYYAYEHLGKLNNGYHVLRTFDCGGGSGIFESLLFIKFSTDPAYDQDDKIYDRLLMTVIREYSLGDRDESKIKIYGDKVIISKSRYREKEVVLKF